MGCASLASPVLHPQPVEPGSPADPDSLREISPPKMFAQLFPVRTSDKRKFICDLPSDSGKGVGRVPDLQSATVLIKFLQLQLNSR